MNAILGAAFLALAFLVAFMWIGTSLIDSIDALTDAIKKK